MFNGIEWCVRSDRVRSPRQQWQVLGGKPQPTDSSIRWFFDLNDYPVATASGTDPLLTV